MQNPFGFGLNTRYNQALLFAAKPRNPCLSVCVSIQYILSDNSFMQETRRLKVCGAES